MASSCVRMLSDIFGHIEAEGCLLDIFLPFNHVRNKGNGAHHLLEDFCLADGVVLNVFQQHACLESDEILLMVVEVLLQLRRAVFLGVAVRVLAVGKQDHAHMHTLFEQQAHGTEGSLDARGVAIVEDGDVGCIAFDEAYLVDGEGGAAGGHGVAHT